MIDKNDILKFIRDHQNYLKERFHLSKIGLFGSFARGANHSDSDIDLLIELEPNTPHIYELKNEMRSYFYDHFHPPIYLSTQKYLKPYAKNQILKETIYV